MHADNVVWCFRKYACVYVCVCVCVCVCVYVHSQLVCGDVPEHMLEIV